MASRGRRRLEAWGMRLGASQRLTPGSLSFHLPLTIRVHPCSSVAKEGLRKRDASRHPLNGKISVPHASLLPHGASLMAHPFLPLRSLRLCGESSEDGPDGIVASGDQLSVLSCQFSVLGDLSRLSNRSQFHIHCFSVPRCLRGESNEEGNMASRGKKKA